MCGITGIYFKTPNHKSIPQDKETIDFFVDMLLLGIEHRGKDATGLLTLGCNSRHGTYQKKDIEASMFIEQRASVVGKPRIILGHTRFATQGHQSDNLNNHPVKYESVFTTHNGHIANDEELFKEHELERKGQVDSEIISALVWKFGLDKVTEALSKLDGGFAVAVIDAVRNPRDLVLAKGPSNPIHYVETPHVLVWASNKSTIEGAWRAVYGNHLPRKKFWHELSYGTMLYVSPSKVENSRFEVYHKPYVSTSSAHPPSSWNRGGLSPSGGGTLRTPHDWESRENELEETEKRYSSMYERSQVRCDCGHTSFWHSDLSYKGPCLTGGCTCRRFTQTASRQSTVEAAVTTYRREGSEVTQIYVECCACEKIVSKSDCITVGGYFICSDCDTEAPDTEEEKREPIPSSRTLAIAEVSESTRLESETVSLDSLNMRRRELAELTPDDMHELAEILDEMSEEMGETAAMLEWILFVADDQVFDKVPRLLSLYVAADDLYHEIAKARQVSDEEVLQETDLCSECGRIIGFTNACPSCAPSPIVQDQIDREGPVRTDEMICIHCEAIIDDNAVVCPRCRTTQYTLRERVNRSRMARLEAARTNADEEYEGESCGVEAFFAAEDAEGTDIQ